MDSQRAVHSGPAEAETVVVKSCQLVLGRPTVRADDDFYVIGGTSLSLIRVITELMDAGYDVDIEQIPVGASLTIRQLAAAVSRSD
ncbi:MAG TPA: phosphopantetheine-binding protein [Acidisarcina sp.]